MLTLICTIDAHTALRTGSPHAGEQRIRLDPATLTPEQRALLQLYTTTNGDTLTLARRVPAPRGGWYSPTPEAATIDAVLAACEVCETRVSADDAEREAQIAAELSKLPDPHDLTQDGWLNYARDDARAKTWTAARETAVREAAAEHVARLLAQPIGAGVATSSIEPFAVRRLVDENSGIRQRVRETREAAEDRATAKYEAAEAAKREQIRACVSDWGDDSQRERSAAGVLPAAEADALIERCVLAPLGDCPRYVRVTWADLDHDEECGGDDRKPSCEVSPATELTREEYAALQTLRPLAEEAARRVGGALVLDTRAHVCSCDSEGCAATLTRLGVLVRITWGQLSVSREYALGTD